MKRSLVALATALILSITASAAQAEPVDVHLRIEGVNQTIFDRVIRTDGGLIQAASDDAPRVCDGTNAGANPEPGPTPTAAGADAMEIIGTDFDGEWYPAFEDYFMLRWGPESENDANGWWWGVLLNGEFTSVGGCQQRIEDGDEVLWANDAFSGRPFLGLAGPETVQPDQPFTVQVSDVSTPSSPLPYEGATVDAITAAAGQFPAGTVTPGTSSATGEATVTFHSPGWKRLKATHPGQPGAAAVPSNSIDVCVERAPGSGCTGEPPARVPAQVGQPPAVEVEEPPIDPGPDPDPEPKPEPRPKPEPGPGPAPGTPALSIVRAKVKPGKVRAGRSAVLRVEVVNRGTGSATGVTVCAAPSNPGARRKARACRQLGELTAGETDGARIRIRAKGRPAKAVKRTIRLRLRADGQTTVTGKAVLRIRPRR